MEIEMKNIQVQCLLDCISSLFQSFKLQCFHPLYFGEWSSPYSIQANRLSYYVLDEKEKFIRTFTQLYGDAIVDWVQYNKTRADNCDRLKALMQADQRGHKVIIALVDLYYLPYPNYSYKAKHRPHMVIVDHMKDNRWFIKDPYFSWQGYVEDEDFCSSLFYERKLRIGYQIDFQKVQPPSTQYVMQLFEEKLHRNNEFSSRLLALVSESRQSSSMDLADLVENAGIITKRKYAYYIAYLYFSQAQTSKQEAYYAAVEQLIAKWRQWCFLLLKGAYTGFNESSMFKLSEKIVVMDELEEHLKTQLWKQYTIWKEFAVYKREKV